MKKDLLDILACPLDKSYPLELLEFTKTGEEITEGMMICQKCLRFFPIMEEIPIMLPDELREREKELEFLKKHQSKLSQETIDKLQPWHP